LLTLVPTPIGNLQDLSQRALKALENADIFLCEDTRVTKKLLTLLKEKYKIEFKPTKFISFHEHNQNQFLSKIDPSFFNQNVVYVSDAGMPGVSDPGSKLIKYCQDNSIDYDVLPGPSAAITAFAASGFEESRFTFFGFLPRKDRLSLLENVLENPYVSILYEAPHRLIKLLEETAKLDENREIFLAKELTKKYQRFYKGIVKDILEELRKTDIKGEWVVVISPGRALVKSSISIQDIISLDIPKKEKAKLLSKITNKSVKEWYEELIGY